MTPDRHAAPPTRKLAGTRLGVWAALLLGAVLAFLVIRRGAFGIHGPAGVGLVIAVLLLGVRLLARLTKGFQRRAAEPDPLSRLRLPK